MRTIIIKNKEVTVSELVGIVQSKLELTADNHPSQYINVCVEDGELYNYFKLRISNHSAKKQNNGDTPTLSFVNDTCDQGYSGMIYNEYVVEDIEEMNTNETNMRGWLSVEEVIEDFINDLKLN